MTEQSSVSAGSTRWCASGAAGLHQSWHSSGARDKPSDDFRAGLSSERATAHEEHIAGKETPMDQPTTELDTRFSHPDAVATDWEETRRVLEGAQLFWISTVRVDGRPHVTPLVAVWLDDRLHFATGEDEQKAVNLRTNQNVILTSGCSEWERGLDVVVEGEAVRVTGERVLHQLAEAWAKKWDGSWNYEVHEGGFRHEGSSSPVFVFAVKPVKVFAFAKGTFAQTRHVFSAPEQ
jgi:nitroimidazol reductase NimA-like FMN-containing flavoprotein (pyridoxamine 5'-phosphate oxidase superfamily)